MHSNLFSFSPSQLIVLLVFLLFGFIPFGNAQQFTGWSLKGGPTLAAQRWDNFNQSPLFGYHFDVQVENLDYSRPASLYASLGYHQRGSAIRFGSFSYVDPTTMRTVNGRAETIRFVFNNLVLAAGAKQSYALANLRGHVAFALRGEYNISTDLGGETAERANNFGIGPVYPQKEFVNDLVYGIDVGAGVEFPLSSKLDGLLELRVSPDFSRQYYQPPIASYFNPFTGNNESAAESKINNFSIELSLGIRFLPGASFE